MIHGMRGSSRHRGILLDQRGAGRSRPHASEQSFDFASIDLDRHIADIELLRQHLGLERWAVFGISWGSVLGIAYAERYPELVSAVVVAAVSIGTAEGIEWLTVGAGRFFPEEWSAFRDHVPAELRDGRLVDAYHQLVMALTRRSMSRRCSRGADGKTATSRPRQDLATIRATTTRRSGLASPARSRTAGGATPGLPTTSSSGTHLDSLRSPAG